MQVNPTLRHAELGDLLIQIGDVDFGAAIHDDRARADLDLRASLRIGPERAAGRDRVIDAGGGPLGVAGGVKRQIARDVADRADAGGRLLLGQRRRRGGEAQEREDQPEAHGRTHCDCLTVALTAPIWRVCGKKGRMAAVLRRRPA